MSAPATLLAEVGPGLLVPALFFAIGALVAWVLFRIVVPLRRLDESARLIARANTDHRAPAEGGRAVRNLAASVNEIAERLAGLEGGLGDEVERVRTERAHEHETLTAVMAEVAEGLLVCTPDGQILLYNAPAQRMLAGDGTGFVGLGRSVFGVLDRHLIAYALDEIERRLGAGDERPVAHVVASAGARLLRVQVVPLLDGERGGRTVRGFLLVLYDVTEHATADARRDAAHATLLRDLRGHLGALRAAVEITTLHPEIEAEQRASFEQIVRDEVEALGDLVASAEAVPRPSASWPREPMLGQDLLLAIRRRAERCLAVPVALDRRVDGATWVEVDAFAAVEAAVSLLARVRATVGADAFTLRTTLHDAFVALDLVWSGPPLGSDTLQRWTPEPVTVDDAPLPFTLGDVLERHDAEIWTGESDGTPYVRLLLPARPAPDPRATPATEPVGSRPIYYDADLLTRGRPDPDVERRPLRALTCTVFDTETTGLNPSEGDEIISVGAVRLVNGRLAQDESFDVLVDPQRPLSLQSIRIHGIEPEMLRGQPRIGDVLPRFHRFVGDSVLVAHNAAFDLRFLQLKEAAAGVRFDGPVLDTLLLSALAFPAQPDHGLDALAARLGVEVRGRHTALGDALVTAEVFLKLIPLLEAEGIATFGDARRASEQTALARLRY
jgi:DNA polymerase-3 subunit epsilon